jgi:acetyl esterase
MSATDEEIAFEAARVAAEIRRLGPVFDEDVLEATYALYVPLQERAPKEGVAIHRDLAYGPDARHRLDIFVPQGPTGKSAPVGVFFHGGGYIGGERSPVPGLIYDNVPTFFARHGLVGVNATYRLAPAHQWPSGGEDVGRVVDWLQEHIGAHGGDPSRIFLVGHSAGATHAATWTFMESVHGSRGPRIAGAVFISGVYAALHPRYSDAKPRDNQYAYYGNDTERWAGMAPFDHVRPGHPPVFIVAADQEPWHFNWPSIALLESIARAGRRMPAFRVLRNHNHVSSALQINSAIDTLGPDILDFVRGIASSPSRQSAVVEFG